MTRHWMVAQATREETTESVLEVGRRVLRASENIVILETNVCTSSVPT